MNHECVHGTCKDGVNNYTCNCQPGYEGVMCDKGNQMHSQKINREYKQNQTNGNTDKDIAQIVIYAFHFSCQILMTVSLMGVFMEHAKME